MDSGLPVEYTQKTAKVHAGLAGAVTRIHLKLFTLAYQDNGWSLVTGHIDLVVKH